MVAKLNHLGVGSETVIEDTPRQPEMLILRYVLPHSLRYHGVPLMDGIFYFSRCCRHGLLENSELPKQILRGLICKRDLKFWLVGKNEINALDVKLLGDPNSSFMTDLCHQQYPFGYCAQ